MTFEEAMIWQSEFCAAGDAPITARVCRALAASLDMGSMTGARAIGWPGDYLADGMPLRLVAPFHALFLAGRCAALSPLFLAEATDGMAAIRAAIAEHDGWIVEWLDGPPQTNEPGRSANFMAALLVLAKKFGLPFEILEIGSSAGLNLLIDRYRYDLGGILVGPAASPVTIRPEWRGSPPPAVEVRFSQVRGVDIAPIDVGDPTAAERLLAYVWADAPQRAERVRAAIAMIAAQPIELEQGDAADWVEARLSQPQESGVMRVLVHSIVWQYLPASGQARILAAMEAAGAAATLREPIGWVAFETDHKTGRQHLTLRCWPGDRKPVELATSHPHGAWIHWSR